MVGWWGSGGGGSRVCWSEESMGWWGLNGVVSGCHSIDLLPKSLEIQYY